jgi:hypothetical protein
MVPEVTYIFYYHHLLLITYYSAVSVKCAGCQKSYHMSCLNPPLIRKPSKGFAWQCAFCTRQEVLADSSSSQSPVSNSRDTPPTVKHPSPDLDNPPSKIELKRQTRATRSQVPTKPTIQPQQPEQETSIKLKIPKKAPKSKYPHTISIIYNSNHISDQQIKMTHMWPFRYFGINTNIGDILGNV